MTEQENGWLELTAFLKRCDRRGVRVVTLPKTKLQRGKPSRLLCGSYLFFGCALPVFWTGLGFLTYLSGGNIGTDGLLSWFIVLIIGACMLTNGFWLLRMRRHMARLSSMEELSIQLGVDKGTLQCVAEERKVKPLYSVNGVDWYDPADLGDVATLLRASAAPVKQEELLRAAAHTETSPDTLLRAANATFTTEEPQTVEIRKR